jgi:hypothetical protein
MTRSSPRPTLPEQSASFHFAARPAKPGKLFKFDHVKTCDLKAPKGRAKIADANYPARIGKRFVQHSMVDIFRKQNLGNYILDSRFEDQA